VNEGHYMIMKTVSWCEYEEVNLEDSIIKLLDLITYKLGVSVIYLADNYSHFTVYTYVCDTL